MPAYTTAIPATALEIEKAKDNVDRCLGRAENARKELVEAEKKLANLEARFNRQLFPQRSHKPLFEKHGGSLHERGEIEKSAEAILAELDVFAEGIMANDRNN